MNIEFTRTEVERIILLHVNTLIPGYGFNEIETRYSSIPSIVTVTKKEEEDAQHRCQQILEMIETDDLAGLKMWSVTIEEM